MANDRSSSKQKRARQNRAQREAREARAKAAAEPASVRQAKYASSGPNATTEAPKKQGFLAPRGEGRPAREPRKIRPGDVAVDTTQLEGNWYQQRLQVPGGRQILTGFLLLMMVSVLSFFVKLPKVEASKGRDALPAETLLSRMGPTALLLIIVPLVIGFAAAHFALSPRRRQIWLWAAVLCFAVSLVGLSWYLFPAGFFAFGIYKARKVEGPAPNSRAARAAARAEDAELAKANDTDD